VALVCLCAVFVTLSTAALALIRHAGGNIGGDEPYYLVEAVSIGHFHTLNLNPGFNYAVIHHTIFPWNATPGPRLAATLGQGHPYLKDGLYLPGHAIGLSALLAVPMYLGTGATVFVLIVLLAALATGLAYLVAQVARIGAPLAIALIGLLFLSPAYVLATTQVYPDLISGLIIAILVMLIALIEIRGRCTTPQLVVGTAFFSFLPWLDAKNILYQLLLLGAFVIVYFRTRLPARQFGWLTIPPLLSVVALVALNLWGFGRPFGASQPISLLSVDTVTRAIALLVDRRQGMFVQVPAVLIGVAGLWVVRRRMPLAALTAVAAVLATTYGNATQQISFGGGSFIGRFDWPSLPILLAFGGLYLLELWKARPRALLVMASCLAALWIVQWFPIAAGEHVYLNYIAWDPSTYQGWWGGLDPSPVLAYVAGSSVNDTLSNTPLGVAGTLPSTTAFDDARNLWGLACWLLIGGSAIYCLTNLLKRPFGGRTLVVTALLGGALVTGALALSQTVLAPPPVSFAASSLPSSGPGTTVGTSRIVTGMLQHGVVIWGPDWNLPSGHYEATIRYKLDDRSSNAASATVAAILQPPLKDVVTRSQTRLTPSAKTASLPFVIHRSRDDIVVEVSWLGTGTLRVDRVALTQTASG
jgi:hypothetical protein